MMKQKKIIVPILTLAVMLLMVGGVYAVFSSTQPEKSKAENVRDTTDQDYHYCALLRKAYHGKATKRCYFLLREDFLLFSRYQQQTKFL